jgi:hypothetical protein
MENKFGPIGCRAEHLSEVKTANLSLEDLYLITGALADKMRRFRKEIEGMEADDPDKLYYTHYLARCALTLKSLEELCNGK